jgi:hypothetical protein
MLHKRKSANINGKNQWFPQGCKSQCSHTLKTANIKSCYDPRSTIIGLIIPEPATGIVTTFDICRFQGVTALALTTLWKPLVFAINYSKKLLSLCLSF